MRGKARHKALLQKGIQHEVYLADSCLAVLFSAQLGKAYLLAGGEVSESAQRSAPPDSLCLQWNVCLHMVAHSALCACSFAHLELNPV